MRWPWQRPAVEHRSSLTDQVITSILAAATGGGARPAATAALESCATLYASALSACAVSGPSSITRALDATWRASMTASLIRNGQALYIIGADPVDGLHLAPVSHWDVFGGPRPSSWIYRCSLSGPSGTAWETRVSGEVLHLRWLVDPARPWAGVSPLQRASDTGSLSGWLEKRLSEEASGPVGSFLPVAKYDADPDADLDAADAGRSACPAPARHWRREGSSAGSRIADAQGGQSRARRAKISVVQRFGAAPGRDLVELREKVTLDVGAACGIPRALLDASTSGAAREAWRQFVATSVDGLCRRIEAQVLDQLGVEVAFDTSTLGGRDLLARGATFRRLAGKKAG